jgi:hypothetical protein
MNKNDQEGREADARDDEVFGGDEVEYLFLRGQLPFVLSCPLLPRPRAFQRFWAGQLLSMMQRVFLLLALASIPLDVAGMPEAQVEGEGDLSPLILSLALRGVVSTALPLFPSMEPWARTSAAPFAASFANLRGIGHGWP